MDLAGFREDRKTYDAVERCLERISEAVVKLGDLAPILVPASPGKKCGRWAMARHEYDVIREDRLWEDCEDGSDHAQQCLQGCIAAAGKCRTAGVGPRQRSPIAATLGGGVNRSASLKEEPRRWHLPAQRGDPPRQAEST